MSEVVFQEKRGEIGIITVNSPPEAVPDFKPGGRSFRPGNCG